MFVPHWCTKSDNHKLITHRDFVDRHLHFGPRPLKNRLISSSAFPSAIEGRHRPLARSEVQPRTLRRWRRRRRTLLLRWWVVAAALLLIIIMLLLFMLAMITVVVVVIVLVIVIMVVVVVDVVVCVLSFVLPVLVFQ